MRRLLGREPEQRAADPITDDSLGAIVDRVLKRAASGEIPEVGFAPSGVQAAVVVRGRVIAGCCMGVDARAVPITPTTPFRVASQSKPVTAVLAVRLVQQGLLDLDAPVWPGLLAWTPDASQTGGFDLSKVTLRTVLSHTGGWSVHGFPSAPVSASAAAPSSIELLRTPVSEEHRVRLLHAPGTRRKYSAGGYAIAEAIIEQAAGASFESALNTHVSRPLGCPSLTSLRPHERPDPAALGFRSASEAAADTFFLCRAASGMTASATDLATVYGAVAAAASTHTPASAQLLPTELAREMAREHRVDDSRHRFGLGFALGETLGRPIIWHAGFAEGTSGRTDAIVDLGAAVSVQVTAGQPSGNIVARRICARVSERLIRAAGLAS